MTQRLLGLFFLSLSYPLNPLLMPSSSFARLKGYFVVAMLLLQISHAETIAGRVVGVSDGDTVTVLEAQKSLHKIRLAGIDAPEKKQAYGDRSKKPLSDLVLGKIVVVQTNKIDKYGRQFGKVTVDAADTNLEQLSRGMAWFYRQYARELSSEDRLLYELAEQEARKKKEVFGAIRSHWSPGEIDTTGTVRQLQNR